MAPTKIVKNGVRGTAGQVVIEYVLLLVIGVTVWMAAVNILVSRNPNSPGAVVKKWVQIIQFIGSDTIEK